LYNGGTLADMLLIIVQGHFPEQLDVEGEILVEERTEAIAKELSLNKEIMYFKKELTVLKEAQEDLSARCAVAMLRRNRKDWRSYSKKYGKPF
jgi:hypothetical protein